MKYISNTTSPIRKNLGVNNMNATNVVSLNFKSKEAMKQFLRMYNDESPRLFPDAKILMMIKITETNCLGISVYPDTHSRDKSRKFAEDQILRKLSDLFEEDFRLTGEVVVHHLGKFTN